MIKALGGIIKNRRHLSPLLVRVLNGVSWNLLATLVARGMPIIALIMVARILDKQAFGQLGIIKGSIAMFEALAAAGMGMTATKHVASQIRRDRKAVARIITLSTSFSFLSGFVLAGVLYLLAPWLASEMLGDPALIDALKIASMSLFFGACASSLAGILTGFEEFRMLAIANGVSGLFSLPLIVGGALTGGVSGSVWGLVAVAFVSFSANGIMVYRVMCREQIRICLNVSAVEWRLLLSFSFPAMMAGVMIGPVNWIGAMLLVNQPNGYSEMAIFSAGIQWFSVMLFIPNVIATAALPIFSDGVGKGDSIHVKKTLATSLKMIAIVVIPVCVIVALFSPQIMQLYGEEYTEGWPVLVLVVCAAMIAAGMNLMGSLFASYDIMWMHFFTNMVWATVFLVSTVVLLRYELGALALAWSLVLGYLAKAAMVWVIAHRSLKKSYY